jgi:hypothetical protein
MDPHSFIVASVEYWLSTFLHLIISRLAGEMSMKQSAYCTVTGTKGKKVDSATVKSMLSKSLREVQEVSYYFCAELDCDVVYFSEDSQQTFRINDIRERVYQKEPDNPDVLICYCFYHTPGKIKRELDATGTTHVVNNITQGIQVGQCACDWRNPQGDCCLGNVKRLLKRWES